MELKGELVLEHEEDKWLTDSALLVDLITHLKELNRCREKSTYLCYISILIKQCENRLRGFKIYMFSFLYSCNSIFSQHKYVTCKFSDGMCQVTITCSTERKFWSCLFTFHKMYFTWEKYPSLHNYTLFGPSLCGSSCIYEQLFSVVKHKKSKIDQKSLMNALKSR